MSRFREHLNEKLKEKSFREAYNFQKQLSDLALRIQKERNKKKISQTDLASMAGITQQQISKIENAINGNIMTYLKVLSALNLEIKVTRLKSA